MQRVVGMLRTNPKRRPQQRSQDTIRCILEATERIRDREGRDAVTTTRVAQLAGVGVGTLYHHFRDRDALLRGVERRAWSQELERLLADAAPAAPTTAAALTRSYVEVVVERIVQRIRDAGVAPHDDGFRSTLRDLWDEAAFVLAGALLPVTERRLQADLAESLRVAIETLTLVSWAAAHRHRDRAGSGALPLELGDMLTRYLRGDGAPVVAPELRPG